MGKLRAGEDLGGWRRGSGQVGGEPPLGGGRAEAEGGGWWSVRKMGASTVPPGWTGGLVGAECWGASSRPATQILSFLQASRRGGPATEGGRRDGRWSGRVVLGGHVGYSRGGGCFPVHRRR